MTLGEMHRVSLEYCDSHQDTVPRHEYDLPCEIAAVSKWNRNLE